MPYSDPEARRGYHRKYMKARRESEKQKDYDRESNKKYREDNWERLKEMQYQWRDENRDKWLEIKRNSSKGHYRRNKPLYRARDAKRRALELKATLKGFDEELKDIYKKCPEGYEVDHIIPLQGRGVCGLHVPWNLQYLPVSENRSKGNKVYDE